MPLRVGWSR